MKKRIFLLCFFAFFLEISAILHAQPEFEASVSNPHLKIGESVLYTIKARWPKTETTYSFLSPEPFTENLELIRRGESQEIIIQDGKEWVQKTFEIEFQAKKPGQARIKSFDLQYLSRNPDDKTAQSQQADKFHAPEQALFFQPQSRIEPIPLVILSFLTLSGALAAFLFFARKKKPVIQAPVLETLQESSLKKILPLSDAHELSEKEILAELSIQFRDFLIKHFDLSLAASSESDVIRALSECEKLNEKTPIRILEQMNESRYGINTLNRTQALSLLRDVTRYIEGTKTV